MQYLKEEIKSRILESALKEFYEKGFLDASMRKIAKDSNVAIGNVYRYFRNKEELFNEIVNPAYHGLITLIEHHDFEKPQKLSDFEILVENLVTVFMECRIQILILFDKSKGTKYENVKDKLILAAEREIIKTIAPVIKERGISVKETFIFNVIAAITMEGILIILRNNNDEDVIRYLVHELLLICFNDIEKRFV